MALTIEIILPASVTSHSIRWTIRTEAGEHHRGEVRLSEQMSGHDRPVEGTIFRTFLVETRLQLPIGYHRLSLETGADDQASSTIIVAPWRAFSSIDLVAPRRHWGVLAPLYGLRSRRQTEIGDLVDLGALAETLGKEGASFLGVNPLSALNPTFPHQASPYSPSSRLHGNELLIGLEASGGSPFTSADRSSADLIDYTSLGHAKMEALRRHYRNVTEGAGEETRRFEQYCARRGAALENFARFRVLFEHFHRQDPGHCWSWRRWPDAYQDPDSHEVQAFAAAHQERVAFFKYAQYLADRQLGEAQKKALAGGMPIGLYLDLAVGVDPHGADCWADPTCFASGANLGAPPDAFNQNGQNWALAPFVPSRLQDRAYQPFIDLLRASMRHAGALRIDHIIGLQQSFWIPDDASLGGAYVRYPIDDLLGIVALESHRHRCLVIGEDLGNLPLGLRERLDSHHISSSRVMYFERDHEQGFCQSQAYPSQALTTVGTHDLPTLAGFWRGRDIDVRASLGIDTDYQSAARKHDREADRLALLRRLEAEGLMPEGIDMQDPPAEVTPCLLAAVHAYLGKSPSALVAVQLEDLLGLVEQANLPGTVDEHPNWRRRMPHDIEELPDLPIARAIFEIMSALRPSPSRQA